MVRNCALIESKIEKGTLTPEMYKNYLEKQLERDKKILKCLQKYNQKNKIIAIKERIECLLNEIKSF